MSISPALPLIHSVYIASICLAPFYFGGERLLAWGVVGSIQVAISILLNFNSGKKGVLPSHERIKIRIFIFSIVLTLLWAALQILPIAGNIIALDIWWFASEIIDQTHSFPTSISPDESFLTLLKLSALAITIWNGRILFEIYSNSRTLISAIAVGGTAYAFLGIYWVQAYPNHHFWVDTAAYGSSVTSTFINRNSFAQYQGIALICATAMAIRGWRNVPQNIPFRSFVRSLLVITTLQSGLYLAMAAVLFTAILLSASRAGTASAIIGIAILLCTYINTNRKGLITISLMISLFIILVAQYIWQPNSDHLNIRNVKIESDYALRQYIYSETWQVLLKRPFAGYGLGSFEPIFRAEKSTTFDPKGIWTRAHNVYLETLLALGIPIGTLAILATYIPFLINLQRLWRSAGVTISHVTVAVTLMLGLHSYFDFGLQSAGNAFTYAAIAGASLAARRKHR